MPSFLRSAINPRGLPLFDHLWAFGGRGECQQNSQLVRASAVHTACEGHGYTAIPDMYGQFGGGPN